METTSADIPLDTSVSEAPIISFDDLVNTVDDIESKENEDKAKIEPFINVNYDELRSRVVAWADAGFPDAYVLYFFQLNKSEKCSDGVVREKTMEYYDFLFPTLPLKDILKKLEQRLPGMTLAYSYTGDFSIRIHISRKIPVT